MSDMRAIHDDYADSDYRKILVETFRELGQQKSELEAARMLSHGIRSYPPEVITISDLPDDMAEDEKEAEFERPA